MFGLRRTTYQSTSKKLAEGLEGGRLKLDRKRESIVRMFVSYVVETIATIAMACIFFASSWGLGLMKSWFDTPMLMVTWSILELALFVLGMLLLVYSVCLISFGFARDVWRHSFAKESEKRRGKGPSK